MKRCIYKPGNDTDGQETARSRKTHGTDPPPRPSEGTHPADTRVSDLWPPELGGNQFLLLRAPSVGFFLHFSQLIVTLYTLEVAC